MPLTEEQIFVGALALPNTARVKLVDKLVESLDAFDDEVFRALWLDECKRRVEDIRSGRAKTIPGDEVLASVRRAVGR